jgi:hypothetical protein
MTTDRSPWPDDNGHDPWTALLYWVAQDYEGRWVKVIVTSQGAAWTDTNEDGVLVYPDTREPFTGPTFVAHGMVDGIIDPGLNFEITVDEVVFHGDDNAAGDGSWMCHRWIGQGPTLDDAAHHVWRLRVDYDSLPSVP